MSINDFILFLLLKVEGTSYVVCYNITKTVTSLVAH